MTNDIIGNILRVLYDGLFWVRNLSEGGRERPLLVVMEETHSYLGDDGSSAASIATQRIVKEGRKYGIGAMIVSPRPAEINPTILSQCGTFKVREGGTIISVAAIIAVAVNTEGKREIVGLHIGLSDAEPFWSSFLQDFARRGLTGVKLVITDAHEGLKAAITRVLGATWQRCRVHFMRNALAYVPKGQNTVVAAAIRQVFLQPGHQAATQVWRQVADQLRTRWPKLGACMDDAEHDVLA